MNNTKDKSIYFPLKIALAFLIISELLVWFGPLKYFLLNGKILLFYLIIVNIALYLGYKRGVKSFHPTKLSFSMSTVYLLLLLGFILTVRSCKMMWARHGLPFNFNTLAIAIVNPGDSYHSKAAGELDISSLTILFAPFQWIAIPLGLFYWRKLPVFYKTIVVLTFGFEIISWLGIGTRKGIFDLIIISFFLIVANNKDILKNGTAYRRLKIWTFIGILLFLFYFVFSNLSRGGRELKELVETMETADFNPFYEKHLPQWLVAALSNITSYLCQGYYALDKALGLGIKPITPGGQSWFTIMLANKVGYDPLPDTYLNALQTYGIDMRINWHTIYVWLANEFTFIGVPFIIYIIGYCFAQTWLDSINHENPLAFPTFALFLIMVYYFYANNQVISFSFMPFVVCVFFYYFFRLIRSR